MTPEDEAMLKSLTPEALAKLAAKAAKLAEQYKARYEANKAKIAEQQKKWNKAHPDYSKKWHKTHPEYDKKHYKNNKDKIDEQHKARHEANPEYMTEYLKKWNKANPEARAEYNKKYAHDHPEVAKAARHNRRARLAGNGGSFTWEEFIDLCASYEFVCVYCGKENIVDGMVKPLTPDHIVAIANGGTGDIGNQYPACLHCNCSKNAKTFDEYMLTLPQEQQEEIVMRIFFAEHPKEREKI